MIHGNSNDPVLIKRISLKIWTLRDEIEAVIQKKLQNHPEQTSFPPELVEEIKKEYSYRGPLEQRAPLTLIQGGADSNSSIEEGEDLEAEMAAAMSDGNSEENSEEEEDLGAEMAAAMGAPPPTDEVAGDQAKVPSEGSPDPNTPFQVIQRSSCNIASSKIIRGISVLGEISISDIYFFSSHKLLEGQSIVIEFQIPKKFVLNAEIIYCRPFNIKSRIISDKKVDYRVVAKFTFLKDGERTLLRQFIQSIEPEIPEAPPAPTSQASSGGEDDDFDGLDGLDF